MSNYYTLIGDWNTSKEIPLNFHRSDGETLSFPVDPIELGKLIQWAYEHREELKQLLEKQAGPAGEEE